MTAPYQAPVDDWMFVLYDLLGIEGRDDLPGYGDMTRAEVRDMLLEASRFHEEVLQPINLAGDREGAHFEGGRVRAPAGFAEAWERYRASGWPFVGVPSALGGGGLPTALAAPLTELRLSTGHSFGMYHSFAAPTAMMLASLGDDWMHERLVPRLVGGEWTATMCLTESHCGSDLSQIRTVAVPQEDGTWRISGEKVFISGGDHDLVDNIVHIVLAKVADRDGVVPAGLAAVHVFVVPKMRVDPATGAVGGPNGVRTLSIEHKMGIEASPTCALAFEDAVGWHLEDETREGIGRTMAPMFFLMNRARISTALSAIAYAELSYQYARSYAWGRLSGSAPGGRRYPQCPADPLVVHPDIRRLLLSARSFAEGGRALALRVALLQSEAEHPTSPSRTARDLVEFLTPVMKAYFTDKGFEAATSCQQVLGGHGYLRDHPVEQWVRNARIGQIYEGANGIQARDLLRNRIQGRGGRASETFFDMIDGFVDSCRSWERFGCLVQPVADAAGTLRRATALAKEFDEGESAAIAYDLLTALGVLALAWTWAESAYVADRDTIAPEVRTRKLTLARLWIERELPLVAAMCERIHAGGAVLAGLSDDEI